MSLANYTVPFAAPVAAPYLATHSFGIPGAPIPANSLYDRHNSRHSSIPPSAHTSPNRRHSNANDPYRNQRPPRQRHYAFGARTDKLYSETDYVNGKKVKSDSDDDYPLEESQVKKYYADNVNQPPTGAPKRKIPEEDLGEASWPDHPPGYTRIPSTFNTVPEPGAKTSVHAVLDFDDDFDDYSYEDEEEGAGPPSPPATAKTNVTPIEGPILIKNGTVPVVPLYSYPTINNGSLVQIPRGKSKMASNMCGVVIRASSGEYSIGQEEMGLIAWAAVKMAQYSRNNSETMTSLFGNFTLTAKS